MTDPTEMTPAERAKVLAAIDRTVDMVRPDGQAVKVPYCRVDERLAAGYQLTTEN